MRFQHQKINFAYDDYGHGPLLFFIHGYPLSRALWQPQKSLVEAGLRFMALDLRGHGDSGLAENEEPHSMETLAADCIALLDHKHIRQPVYFCGLSLGGYVCFALQRLYPERVAGLILTATRSAADSPAARATRQQAIETVRLQGRTAIYESMLPRLLSPHSLEHSPKVVRQTRAIMDTVAKTETIIKDQLGLMQRPDSTPVLADFSKPALVIHGADDQIIPLAEAESMAAALPVVPNAHARLIVLPQAGHLPNLEQPEMFNQAILQFFSEREP